MNDALGELRWRTPAAWTTAALADELALLADHAHLEQAAASNAMALVRRWPDGADPDRWVRRLAGRRPGRGRPPRPRVAHVGGAGWTAAA